MSDVRYVPITDPFHPAYGYYDKVVTNERLFSVSNGFTGYGQTACLVMAEDQSQAIDRAVDAFRSEAWRCAKEDAERWCDRSHMRAVAVELPYVGDELP